MKGAFWDLDFLLFDLILNAQTDTRTTGDLLEIGALYGKSTILLGLSATAGEEVVVCDVFEEASANLANDIENTLSYPELARAQFEQNYRTWVPRPARVVQGLSDTITQHVAAKCLRFAHIDGGHHFDVVADDLRNTRDLLGDRGIMVIDDFRALHTPGVAAAAWTAVVDDGLVPFCVSEQKLYASWSVGAAEQMLETVRAWASNHTGELNAGVQNVAGHSILILENPLPSTPRDRLVRLIPPAVKLALRGRPKPYLGQPL
ncbi:hypothetical protein ACVW00_003420 [Marmoricola sp. URHA0025 HA25]